MFYGDFKGDRKDRFRKALETIEEFCGPIYGADNLIAIQRSAGFREDERFVQAHRRNAETQQEQSLGWRLHSLAWAARHALKLDGDFVECGVWKGFCFGFLTDYLDFGNQDRLLYLYDTFSGIPDDMNSEHRSNAIYEQDLGDDPDAIYEAVRRRFAGLANVRIVRGRIPDSFAGDCPERIALLHIDLNSAASEIATLEALFDRVVTGGAIVFDDYGWHGYSAQRRAEDAFMADRAHTILELPTGQGLVIKQ